MWIFREGMCHHWECFSDEETYKSNGILNGSVAIAARSRSTLWIPYVEMSNSRFYHIISK